MTDSLFVVAAYVVGLTALVGYAVSLLVRQRRADRLLLTVQRQVSVGARHAAGSNAIDSTSAARLP